VLRLTRQREVILRELRKLTSHPTADALYLIVRQHLPRISLGTIYRNLEELSAAGLIQKLEFGGGQRRFDGTVDDHLDVRCTDCGRGADVSGARDSAAQVRLDGFDTEFALKGYRLELMGTCPACQRA